MRNLTFLLIACCMFTSIINISSQVPAPTIKVKAQFEVTINPNDTSIFIQNKSSKNASTYVFNFGDGTAILDTQLFNHTYKYAALGTYNICLTVTDTTGLTTVSDTYCSSVEFTQQNVECAADFTYVMKGLTVTVNNISNGSYNKLLWDFGDGVQLKNKDSVSHTYKKSGAYDISLFVRKNNSGCESKKVKTIIAIGTNTTCVASYSYFNDSGKRVIFTNQSIGGALTYQWSFGDGTISNDSSPVHEYNFPGIYEVILQAENKNYSLKSSYSSFISVDTAEIDVVPDFEAITDPVTDTVEFKNTSLGSNINSYIWNFGDGTISNDSSPVHVYIAPDDYSVCLSIVPKTGNAFNTRCKNISAGIPHTNLPDFSFVNLENDSISFESQFCYNPDSLLWDFGDNTVSSDTQPVHQFPGDGIYLVSLKFKYNYRIYENIRIVNTTSNQAKLFCRFKYINGNETSHLKASGSKVKFKGSLSGDVSRRIMYWDFGDGTKDSTSQEPEHTYQNSGTYEVCFSTFNYLTGDTDIYCDSVKVGTIDKIQSIKEQSVTYSIYPNPANEHITLNIYASKAENASMDLYDLSGRMVSSLYKGNIMSGFSKMSFKLNIRKGIYLLRVQTSTEISSVKLLIE